jgi:O-antigen ligase
MRLLNNAIFYSLLLLLLLTPLPYGTVETWSITVWELWIFATTLLWGIQVALTGRLSLSRNPLALPLVGLLAFAVIQLLPLVSGSRPTLSYQADATWQAAIKLLAFILFFVLFGAFVNTGQRRDLVVNAIIGLAFIIALVGIGQSYIGKALWQRGTFGPFVNRNHFAGFLEMGLGLAGGLLAGRGVKRERIVIYGCVILVLLAGLVVSASRGGMLACLAGAIFLLIVARPERETESGERGPALARLAATFFLFLVMLAGVMLLAGPEDLFSNFSHLSLKTGTEVQVSESRNITEQFRRRDIWTATARLISDHPLCGVGLGAYPTAYPRYDPSSGSQRVEQAHNDYLQIVADTGVIGGLMALSFIVLLAIRGMRATRTRDQRHRAIVIGALTGCFAIAIHSFVDFNLQVTANAQLFLSLAALATTPRSHTKET